MRLDHISILNFKNIAEAELDFCEGVNCLVGAKGMGKGNMLEAVYHLSMTRSVLRLPGTEVIPHGSQAMMVRGDYTTDSGRNEQVSIGYSPERRKVLRRGGKEYRRMSAHIGTLPVVLVSPQDHFLITGSPEERRRLMDTVISQADAAYLSQLIRYNKALQQRNSLLRQGLSDPLLTESLEIQMEDAATAIFKARQNLVEALREPFCRYYAAIAGAGEQPGMLYESVMAHKTLRKAFDDSRRRDSALGHTSEGIHRDDLALQLDRHDLRRLGSQGQMKTYTIALRMAVFEYLHSQCGISPLLLLDDIFDKLDAARVQNIMQVVSDSDVFGQIFITDTGREHIDTILDNVPGQHLLLGVESGRYTILKSSRRP